MLSALLCDVPSESYMPHRPCDPCIPNDPLPKGSRCDDIAPGGVSPLCVPPPAPCPSNAYVQAAPGFGSVNFRTVAFGAALFNRSYCVLRVLSNTWALSCRMFMFCVKEADWGMMAFVAYFVPWFSDQYTTSFRKHQAQGTAEATPWAKQHENISGDLPLLGQGEGVVVVPPITTGSNAQPALSSTLIGTVALVSTFRSTLL